MSVNENEQAYISTLGSNESLKPKLHTIRRGSRWKAGDGFSPRIWSAAPYRSKQIVIGPDMRVERVWAVRMEFQKTDPVLYVDDSQFRLSRDVQLFERLAVNDGLDLPDFISWFAREKEFRGQVICWVKGLEYA